MCRLNKKQVLEHYGGEVQHSVDSIFANLSNGADEGSSGPAPQLSSYLNPYDEDVEKFLKFNQDNLTIFSMNTDSLHAKHTEIQIFVEQLHKKHVFFIYCAFRKHG